MKNNMNSLFIFSLLSILAGANSQLFGVGGDLLYGVMQLYQYNSESGDQIALGPPRNLESHSGTACIDPKTGIYYFLAWLYGEAPAVYGVVAKTGKLVSTLELPFTEDPSKFIGVGIAMAWAADLDLIVITGQNEDQSHPTGTLNPKDGTFTLISTLDSIGDNQEAISAAYVPDKQIFVVSIGTNTLMTYSLDMKTKKWAKFTDTNDQNIGAMVFNQIDGLIYGLGFQSSGSKFNRTLVTLDASTMKIDIVGVIKGFAMQAEGTLALNLTSQTIFWVGSSSDSQNQFFILQTALKDATMVSVSQNVLCNMANFPNCPSTLAIL